MPLPPHRFEESLEPSALVIYGMISLLVGGGLMFHIRMKFVSNVSLQEVRCLVTVVGIHGHDPSIVFQVVLSSNPILVTLVLHLLCRRSVPIRRIFSSNIG